MDGQQAIVLSFDEQDPRESRIEHPRQDALIDEFVVLIGCNHGGQLFVIPVVQELIELFPRPGRGLLGPQIVENQKVSIADLLETLVVRDPVVWIECGSQLIEQVRYDPEVTPIALVRRTSLAIATARCVCPTPYKP